jgi:hypothetical protein
MRKLELSPYYPPRARWYSPLLRIADVFRRITWLDRIHLPGRISADAFVAALLLPGLAFRLRRERLIAGAVMGGHALLALVFVIWLGHPVANIAFGLMLSLHATSILFLISPWLENCRLLHRLLAGLVVLVTLGGLLYYPALNFVEARWLRPLSVGGHVVVVQSFSPPRSVRRGDWIAYRVEGDGGEGWWLEAGMVLRPVLAVAGDRVRFTPTACLVNGVPQPRQAHMPTSGELVVPENSWFLWPDLDMRLYGNAAPTTADAVFLRMAGVSQSQYVGKPFHRWFWRRQQLQ